MMVENALPETEEKDLKRSQHPTIFYGWVIVGISAVSMMLVYNIRNSFAVFFPPILDEFGWSRGSTSFMLSLNLLVYGFLAPVTGSLADYWKPRGVIAIGVLTLGLATALCYCASELWHFYLLFGILMPIGTAFCGWPILAPMLANWFVKRRGLAMGLGQTGGGLSFVYSMFGGIAISRLGWRNAYLALAGVLLAILLPLHYFLFHYRPESKGLMAYGGTHPHPAEGAQTGTSPAAALPFNPNILAKYLKSHRLWLLFISNLLYWGIGAYMILAHQVKFVEDVGYSSMFAISIFTIFGACMTLGQLSGFVSDWIGRTKAIVLAVVLAVGGVAALASIKDTSTSWPLYAYAICFGMGTGLYSPTLVAGAADIFHGRDFGAVAGIVLTGTGVGGVIGPWLGGYIHDITGSYTVAFLLCTASFALSGLAYVIAVSGRASKVAYSLLQSR